MHRKVDEIHRAVRALWKDLTRLERARKERDAAERAPTERAPAKRTRAKGR